MPRSTETNNIRCEHYRWRLVRRDDFYYADGRAGNAVNLGRHSLGTHDRAQAVERLRRLDQKLAVRNGKIPRPQPTVPAAVPLEDGIRIYLEHVGRPAVAGGASAKTLQRYHAVLAKFRAFATRTMITSWVDVTGEVITAYLRDLEQKGYARRTLYLEGTTLLQINKHLVLRRKLPEASRVRLSLVKEAETSTFCYSRAEVTAIIDFCSKTPGMMWLADVVMGLSRTGMRIGELAQLTWSDVDIARDTLHIRHQGPSTAAGTAKSTKGKRSRTVPICSDLKDLLIRRRKSAKPQDPVFTGPAGGRLDPDSVRVILVRDVLKPLDASGGLKPRSDGRSIAEGRVHSFRHFFASQTIQQGVPADTVQKWLGHRDSKMVAYYSHLNAEESYRQIQKLSFAAPGYTQAISARARSA